MSVNDRKLLAFAREGNIEAFEKLTEYHSSLQSPASSLQSPVSSL